MRLSPVFELVNKILVAGSVKPAGFTTGRKHVVVGLDGGSCKSAYVLKCIR